MNEMTLHKALTERRTVREFDNRSLERDVLQRLLWAAQGITGDANKRTAPSAHTMHPLIVIAMKKADSPQLKNLKSLIETCSVSN